MPVRWWPAMRSRGCKLTKKVTWSWLPNLRTSVWQNGSVNKRRPEKSKDSSRPLRKGGVKGKVLQEHCIDTWVHIIIVDHYQNGQRRGIRSFLSSTGKLTRQTSGWHASRFKSARRLLTKPGSPQTPTYGAQITYLLNAYNANHKFIQNCGENMNPYLVSHGRFAITGILRSDIWSSGDHRQRVFSPKKVFSHSIVIFSASLDTL